MTTPTLATVMPHLLVAVLMVVGGCQSRVSLPSTGRSSFTILEQPRGPERKPVGEPTLSERQPRDVYSDARPAGPLETPVFPPAALRGGADSSVVGVRLSIDAKGNVTDVATSVVAFSTPGPFAGEFRAAVEAAVRRWKFIPAERRHVIPMPNAQKDYWYVKERTPVESMLDVAFTFHASGEVTSAR